MLSCGIGQDEIQGIPVFVIRADDENVLSGIKVYCNEDQQSKIISSIKRTINKSIREAIERAFGSEDGEDDEFAECDEDFFGELSEEMLEYDWKDFCEFTPTDYGLYIRLLSLGIDAGHDNIEAFSLNCLSGIAKRNKVEIVGYVGQCWLNEMGSLDVEYVYLSDEKAKCSLRQLIGENLSKFLLLCKQDKRLDTALKSLDSCNELLDSILYYEKWIDEEVLEVFPDGFREKAAEKYRKAKG